ncbi:MAG: hypothetical protein NC218_01230 [Acetobacter sp.]|nr:hypothetical protein [Acetobacter sp.]
MDRIELKAELKAQAEEMLTAAAVLPTALKTENVIGPEKLARAKARCRLAELKDEKGHTEVSFADLRENGVLQEDMNAIIAGERLKEVHSSKRMEIMGIEAKRYDARTGGQGNCAQGVNKITMRADTCRYDYRIYQNQVETTYHRSSKTAKPKETQGTATAQLATMHQQEKFVCFDFESNMKGNPDIRNIQATGTILGFPGSKNSAQPAGHITCLGPDGKWHTDITEDMDRMCSDRVAERYGCNDKGTYCIIFTSDATLSDAAAEDILYQQYIREWQEREKERAVEKQNDSSEKVILAKYVQNVQDR